MNRLGSVVAITDEAGQIVWQGDYFAYGTMQSESGGDNSWKYTGQEWDETSGIYNYKARFYDQDFEHFLTGDPAGEGYSPYIYVHGKPSMLVDLTGKYGGGGGMIGDSDELDNPAGWITGPAEIPFGIPIYFNQDGSSPYTTWKNMHREWTKSHPEDYVIIIIDNVNDPRDYSAKVELRDSETKELIDEFRGRTTPDDPSLYGTIESNVYEYLATKRISKGEEVVQLRVLYNGTGNIPAEGGINIAHPERSYLTKVWIHAGNIQPHTIRKFGFGSEGCPLIHYNDWNNFMSYFPFGASGNLYILRTAGYYWITASSL